MRYTPVDLYWDVRGLISYAVCYPIYVAVLAADKIGFIDWVEDKYFDWKHGDWLDRVFVVCPPIKWFWVFFFVMFLLVVIPCYSLLEKIGIIADEEDAVEKMPETPT